MGVTGIWEFMNKYGRKIELEKLRGKTIAVDGQIWLMESVRGTKSHGLSSASYLSTFFNRCQRLREHGIEPFIVFDNCDVASCSQYSLAKMSKSIPASIGSSMGVKIQNIRELLMAMGIRCLYGSAEGEAQCAYLERIKAVDGCITTDFDYFLFGGQTMYKIKFTSRGIAPEVDSFFMADFEKIGFNRNRFVALAMLVGCDYLDGGIEGVGIVTALEIISEFAIHVDDHPISLLDRFAAYFRQEIPERRDDSKLRLRLKGMKIEIPEGFPNTENFCEVATVYLVPSQREIEKENIPPCGRLDEKEAQNILQKECGWSQERFQQEIDRSFSRTANGVRNSRQTVIDDYFMTRRRSTPVVVSCTLEEHRKCSQRQIMALEQLKFRNDQYSYAPKVSSATPPSKISKPKGNIRQRKRPTLPEDGTPTTSTHKRRLKQDNTTVSNSSSVIFLG